MVYRRARMEWEFASRVDQGLEAQEIPEPVENWKTIFAMVPLLYCKVPVSKTRF